MKVKITKTTSNREWYLDLIGFTFEVYEKRYDDDMKMFLYTCKEDKGKFISEDNCVVVEEKLEMPEKVTEEWARQFLKDGWCNDPDRIIHNLKLPLNNRIICKSVKEELDEFYEIYKHCTMADRNNFIEKSTFAKLYELAIKAIKEND